MYTRNYGQPDTSPSDGYCGVAYLRGSESPAEEASACPEGIEHHTDGTSVTGVAGGDGICKPPRRMKLSRRRSLPGFEDDPGVDEAPDLPGETESSACDPDDTEVPDGDPDPGHNPDSGHNSECNQECISGGIPGLGFDPGYDPSYAPGGDDVTSPECGKHPEKPRKKELCTEDVLLIGILILLICEGAEDEIILIFAALLLV